jgi:hypothetical protein
VVVAIGIYIGNAARDAALVSGGEFAALPTMALPLRAMVEIATDRGVRPADRVAICYPAWWDSLQVDRLLRHVRANDVTVDRYLTSGEAVVTWWRHAHGHANDRRAGPFLVYEVDGDSAGLTLVNADGPSIETISSREVSGASPAELVDAARQMTAAARLVVADITSSLVAGIDDPKSSVIEALHSDLGRPVWCSGDDEHAVAFGTALAATF